MNSEEILSGIEKVFEDWKVPGGAVSIFQNGELLLSKGFGTREKGKGQPVDAQTLFPIASCTKAFTAAAVGILVDDGSLNWDDKVCDHLPGFELYDPWITREVTIRDMLCHRTGLGRAIRLLTRDKEFNTQDYRERLKYIQPDAEFRSAFGYNNHHYVVAGLLIEAVSGKSWQEFIKEQIFVPLGMHSSYCSYKEMLAAQPENLASPHINAVRDFLPADLHCLDEKEPIAQTDYGNNPAGSIISCLEDMQKWASILLNKGKHGALQLLSEECVREMFSPQMLIKPGEADMDAIAAAGVPVDNLTYGLGWFNASYRGKKMVFHPGQLNGFVSSLAFLPEQGIGGVILMNTYHTLAHAMVGYYIFDALQGIDSDYSSNMANMFREWKAGASMEIEGFINSRPADAKLACDPALLTGTYSHPVYGQIEITLQGEKLHFQYGERDLFAAELELWAGNSFVINYHHKVNPLEFMEFIFAEDGAVQALAIKDLDVFTRQAD